MNTMGIKTYWGKFFFPKRRILFLPLPFFVLHFDESRSTKQLNANYQHCLLDSSLGRRRRRKEFHPTPLRMSYWVEDLSAGMSHGVGVEMPEGTTGRFTLMSQLLSRRSWEFSQYLLRIFPVFLISVHFIIICDLRLEGSFYVVNPYLMLKHFITNFIED